MKEVLERIADGHQFYHARMPEYASTDPLPFRISPEPFYISDEQAKAIGRIGQEVCGLMQATAELYETNDDVHELLDRGKPAVFQNVQPPQYLFFRPDMIITSDGFAICEIETSVFGLAVAELLNQGYSEAGFETLARPGILGDHIEHATPSNGTIVYTDKTKAFVGQLEFLAEKVFSGRNRQWRASHIGEASGSESQYRAHYLVEYLTDAAVQSLYDSAEPPKTMPSLSPQFEEKAILAFIWDKRFEDFYSKALGAAGLELLRTAIPPTWIVGEEQYFAPGLPAGMNQSVDLAGLARSKRGFVLKPSGFSSDSSWSEGVTFLQSMSHETAAETLGRVTADATDRLYVVQEFKEGVKNPMSYDGSDDPSSMQARVRLTPYFSNVVGELLGIKATGCEGTHLIHASTASVNTAVSIK